MSGTLAAPVSHTDEAPSPARCVHCGTTDPAANIQRGRCKPCRIEGLRHAGFDLRPSPVVYQYDAKGWRI
jgi:hypothetical protein